MLSWIGHALMAAGVIGFVVRSVEFVRVTIPRNYGSNPGFGAYESMVLPWFSAGFIGLGIVLGSWRWALLPIAAGLVGLGFVAMLLSKVFGRRAAGD